MLLLIVKWTSNCSILLF